MERFLIWRWNVTLPECGATSTLARGETPTARWLHEHQPITNQSVGSGFHTVCGGIDPGDLRFRPRVVGVVEIWKEYDLDIIVVVRRYNSSQYV